MRIFDGVELKPPLSPTMQGAISWALLIANTLIEAGNCRDERRAREAGTTRPATLEQVMQQSGLRIPGIEEALEQLMGGTEEAKQAAELLVNNPDPAVLLQKFAEHFGLKIMTEPRTSATAPTPPIGAATPPAESRPPVASTEPFPPMATRTSEPTMTAPATSTVKAPPPPALRPPQFRADFSREAREAAKATATAPPRASAPRSTEPTVSRPSLVEMVERQLGALRRSMEAHQAEINERLGRAESELDALRERLSELLAARRPLSLRVVPPQASEPVSSTMHRAVDAPTLAEQPVAPTNKSTFECLPTAVGPEGGCAAERSENVAQPLPLAATEEEVVRAVELVGAFGDEVEAQHRQSVARLTRVEHELHVMRVLVARADAGGEETDGEAQPEEADAVHG